MRIYFQLEIGNCYLYNDHFWLGKDFITLIRLDGNRVIQCKPWTKPEPVHSYDCKDLKKAWNCTTKQLDDLGRTILRRDTSKGTPVAVFTGNDLLKIYKVTLTKKELN